MRRRLWLTVGLGSYLYSRVIGDSGESWPEGGGWCFLISSGSQVEANKRLKLKTGGSILGKEDFGTLVFCSFLPLW